MGELVDYNPSGNGFENDNNYLLTEAYDLRDSGVTLTVWPILAGGDANSTMTEGRTQMNALGYMLELLFPGSSVQRFSVWRGSGGSYDNDFARTVTDTTFVWCEAFGKYFGYPTDTRDTSVTGTDDASQTYTVHQFAMLDDSGATDTLTYVIGRHTRGTNYTIASTDESVDLPFSNMFELDTLGLWTAHAYDTAYVSNGQFRIFSTDTLLSNSQGVSVGQWVESASEESPTPTTKGNFRMRFIR